MKTLHSKRHFLYFWIMAMGTGLLCLSFGSMAAAPFFRHIGVQKTTTAEQAFMIGGIGLALLSLYTIRGYWKVTPSFEMDSEKLIYNRNEIYYWKDLTKAELSGNRNSGFIAGEATTLEFSHKKEIVLFDSVYQNSWLVKLYIEQIIMQGHSELIMPVTKFQTHISGNPVYVKGSLWRSFPVYISMLFVILAIVVLIDGSEGNSWRLRTTVFAGIISIVYLLCRELHYYYGITETQLIIRNWFWPGYLRIYQLEDLREIMFESVGKGSRALTLIKKDFRKDFYIGETLATKDWLELLNQLEARKYKVRNESIYELW